jgi:hypothetical protein
MCNIHCWLTGLAVSAVTRRNTPNLINEGKSDIRFWTLKYWLIIGNTHCCKIIFRLGVICLTVAGFAETVLKQINNTYIHIFVVLDRNIQWTFWILSIWCKIIQNISHNACQASRCNYVNLFIKRCYINICPTIKWYITTTIAMFPHTARNQLLRITSHISCFL